MRVLRAVVQRLTTRSRLYIDTPNIGCVLLTAPLGYQYHLSRQAGGGQRGARSAWPAAIWTSRRLTSASGISLHVRSPEESQTSPPAIGLIPFQRRVSRVPEGDATVH
jgi:hypothetical protein